MCGMRQTSQLAFRSLSLPRFDLEGMMSKYLISLQRDHLSCGGSRRSINKWMTGLIQQLLQVTHAQCWIYRNILVHDRTTGSLITAHKEELQR